jgi:hypothetical protein
VYVNVMTNIFFLFLPTFGGHIDDFLKTQFYDDFIIMMYSGDGESGLDFFQNYSKNEQ